MLELPKEVKTTRNVPEDEINRLHDFYYYEVDKVNLEIKDLKFEKVKITALLKRLGFFRFIYNENLVYIRLCENKIELVNPTRIIDALEDYVLSLPVRTLNLTGKDISRVCDITPEQLHSKLYNYLSVYSADSFLERLRPNFDINFQQDSKSEKYVYFKNKAVRITPTGINVLEYSELTKVIWDSAVLSHNFNYSDRKGDFEIFFEDITGADEDRKKSLMSILGYLTHDFYYTDLKAVFLTDANEDGAEKAAGRTGKGLLGKALGCVLNKTISDTTYVAISGKNIDFCNPKRYAQAEVNTQLIHIEDPSENFKSINPLFNDITDGAELQKHYQLKPIKKYIKFLITMNQSILLNGSSELGRSIIFELHNFYSDTNRPADKFGRRFFEEEWQEKDWNEFYSFMCRCILTYMRNGVIKTTEINYSNRGLIERYGEDFKIWVDRLFAPHIRKKEEVQFIKNIIFAEFYSKYGKIKTDTGDYINGQYHRWTQRTFSQNLRQYCTQIGIPFCETRGTVDYCYIYPTKDTFALSHKQKAAQK